MSLADYLAKNYLTADAPEKASKKRKRKQKDAAGLTIDDDEATAQPSSTRRLGPEDDDLNPQIVSSNEQAARRFKKSGFKTVGSVAPTDDAAQREADAQLAAAAAEEQARRDADDADNAPQIVNQDDADDEAVLMSNGAAAGLQTAEQVGRMLARRAREERRRFDAETAGGSNSAEQETVYRDASGRVINVAMKRAEARRAAEDADRAKAAQLEATKGEVQRAEQEDRRRKLADARLMTVARGADDAEMNEELKARDRWDDPALGFLVRRGKKAASSRTGKPLYAGSAAPNRHGVRPGYRWDGVDRSTGWEAKRFAAANRRQDLKNLQYAWQMDE